MGEIKNNELTPMRSFEITLKKYEGNIKDLLQFHSVSPAEFMAIATNAVRRNPELLKCEPKSLFGAILTAAELGLPPNTPAQFSHILPYKRSIKKGGNWETVLEAQFQLGYPGALEIMYRNPRVKAVKSDLIYEKDEFEDDILTGIKHKPFRSADRGKRIGAYCIVWLKDSEIPIFKVMWDYEIEKFKKISKSAASDASPWKDEEKDPMGWMWRKTAIKQVAKEIPKTKAIERLIQIDNAMETGGSMTVTEDGEAEVIENEDFKLDQKNEEAKADVAERSDKTLKDVQNKIFKEDKNFPKE